MKRKLLKQICCEWRGNIWMIVELIVVGLVMWGISTIFTSYYVRHQPPKGYQIDNIYIALPMIIPEEASGRVEYPDSLHSPETDLDLIVDKLSSNPYVEMVGLGTNSMPYAYNYYGGAFLTTIDTVNCKYYGNQRYFTPDLLRTIRLTGVNGETTEDLVAVLERGELIFADTPDLTGHDIKTSQWIGRDVYLSFDSSRVQHVGAVISGIARDDYERMIRGGIILPPDPDYFPQEVVIRVKEGMGEEFLNSVSYSDLEAGNVYLTNLQSLESRRDRAHMMQGYTIEIRNLIGCSVFLFVVVFLGFLGAFWFRTQERVPELALRKCAGATNASLCRRLLSEGLLLLVISAPVIALLGHLIINRFDISDLLHTEELSLIWISYAITLAAIALIIVAGILMPAMKAMHIDPANAIKEQ